MEEEAITTVVSASIDSGDWKRWGTDEWNQFQSYRIALLGYSYGDFLRLPPSREDPPTISGGRQSLSLGQRAQEETERPQQQQQQQPGKLCYNICDGGGERHSANSFAVAVTQSVAGALLRGTRERGRKEGCNVTAAEENWEAFVLLLAAPRVCVGGSRKSNFISSVCWLRQIRRVRKE